MSALRLVSFYCFTPLQELAALREQLAHLCAEHALKGTISIAAEGINATLAGEPSGIAKTLATFEDIAPGSTTHAHQTELSAAPFKRMKVRLRKEIITMATPDLNAMLSGTHVPPEEWNEVLDDPNIWVIDARNRFESATGSFKNATSAPIDSFAEFPRFANTLRPREGQQLALFCTGGIRCEKATAYLRQYRGFKHILQLRGGILAYLRQQGSDNKNNRWQGRCFVFDERISV